MSEPTKNDSEIFRIGADMVEAGYSLEFVKGAIDLAVEYEGARELMRMWIEEENETERDAIIADLQELIEDVGVAQVEKKPYIPFDDLSEIADDVMAFKDRLRQIVDEQGGVTELSERTGIPQPSLSRFFNTASMPRRSTLLKIADALELSEKESATEWTR
jgi:DNA-binding phage protein